MKGGRSACQGGDIHDPLFCGEVQRREVDLVSLLRSGSRSAYWMSFRRATARVRLTQRKISG
jgi:hypothetical protein